MLVGFFFFYPARFHRLLRKAMIYNSMYESEKERVIIGWEYDQAVLTASDINEHLHILRNLARKCSHITEIGLMYANSSKAFLMTRPKKLVSIEKHDVWPQVKSLQSIAIRAGIDWEIINKGSLEIEIDETDMLFIDSFHTYGHLKNELKRHGNKARKYLAFHDTVTFGKVGEDGSKPGLVQAIKEFQKENPHWKLHKDLKNNNGLTILIRNSNVTEV